MILSYLAKINITATEYLDLNITKATAPSLV